MFKVGIWSLEKVIIYDLKKSNDQITLVKCLSIGCNIGYVILTEKKSKKQLHFI